MAVNFAGKSGLHAELGSSQLDSLSQSVTTVTIPDAHLLFSGDYARSGSDLIVSDALHRVVVSNYFHGEKRPLLVSPEGAPLDPAVVAALTGHVQYAQAAPAASAAKVVGHVVKMTGSASIVRNGVTIAVNNGDVVYQNDVVQTGSGSTLGLVMIDGTTFNLSANARLMLNDLTYDANSTSNTALFTMVQGAAHFVAGQVAKTGDMKVGTPVATMGIRGTAVILDISAVDGKVSISVVNQQDNQVHAVEVFDRAGNMIGTVTSNGSSLTLSPTATFEVIASYTNKTVLQVQQEFSAFQGLLSTYDIGKQLVPSTPAPTDGRRGDANPQTTTKFAGTTIIPSDSSVTKFNTDIAGTKDVKGDAVSADAAALKPTTDLAVATAKVAVVVGDTPVQVLNVAVTSIPFIVTPSPVSRISSGSGDHFGPVMSADGQFVTYDPDGAIFLFDRQSGTTATIASPGAGFTYGSPTISADGHFVAYQGSDGTQSFIFLYNNNASDTAHYGQTTRLMAGGQPAVSGDGSKIIVERGGSIGLYDQQGHELANVTAATVGISGTLWKPAISADGHIIAFWSSSSSSPGGAGQLFTYDLSTATLRSVATTVADAGNSAASFSADGNLVVYQSSAPAGHSEIYLYDLRTNQIVFHTANGEASYNPVISPDGHFIIFASDARLTADDKNTFTDVYVVDVTDLAHPVFKLVSVLDDGTQGNAASNLGAAISAGGQFVAFGTSASNFATDDTPGTGDIFVVDPASGHSAIILEGRNSPAVLTTAGVIKLTGDHTGVTLGVSDTRLTASFDSHGDIQWRFSEQRSDFASLQPGQISVQNFVITLSTDRSTTAIPVKVSIYDVDQTPAPAADAAPVAIPVTLAGGIEDTSYTITSAALLAGVVDIDGPSLSITALGIASGGGTIVDKGNGTFTYLPAPNYNGPVTFSYTVSDGTLSASSTASLNLAASNDAPVLTHASLTIAEGSTVVLAASDIGVSDPDSASFTFAVSNLSHGTFETTANGISWAAAATFTTAELNAGHVRFVHDGGEDAPTFSIRADDGAGGLSAVVAGSVSFTGINDAPVITRAALTIPEGGTAVLAPSDLVVTDPDNNSFVFTTSDVSHGAFQLTTDGVHWVPATTFTSADLNAGHVRFVHDGGEDAPTFSVRVNDGDGGLSTVVAGSVSFSNVNDVPVITKAALAIAEGGTAVLGPTDLAVIDPDNTSFVFTTSNVSHGAFQVTADGTHWVPATTFTSAELEAGHVRFVHDGGENAPTFSIQADDGAGDLSSVVAGSVSFTGVNDVPVVTRAALSIPEGGPAVLGPSDLAVTDPDNNSFVFTTSNVSHGAFQVTTDGTHWVPATTFNSADLNAGHVRFVHDGGEDAPTFSIRADDGDGGLSSVVAGSVSFTGVNDVPVITRAALTIPEGGSAVLGPSDLAVTDPDNNSFVFTTSNVSHGAFQVTTDGTHWVPATTFNSADLNAGHVRFVHDGGEAAPTFSIQADDGQAFNHTSTTVDGVVTFTNTNDVPTVSSTVTGGGAEDTGPATVHLLDFASDGDPGAVLHVAGLAWTDTGNGLLPAGFALGPDGNSITVDTSNLAYNALAQGETFAAHFAYDVVDEHGASVHQTATVTVAGTNDAPTVTSAGFSVSEGGTAVLDETNIGVSDPDSSSFSFTVSNVSHGTFQLTSGGTTWNAATTFTTADLKAGHVRFVHDGGADAPTFSIRADDGDGGLSSVVAGSVNFTGVNDVPVITRAALAIAEGGTAVLGPSDLAVTDPDNNSFVFTTSNVSHGAFQITADGINWVPATTFNSADLNAGHVRFVHDGGEAAPTFSIQADDGAGGLSTVVAGSVNFTNVNDVPVITGVNSGVVHEDDTLAARTITHQFTATDPDDTTAPVWTVEGGTTPHAAQYSFRIQEFKVTRTGNDAFTFDDSFDDGNAPSGSASYATTGSFVETPSNGGFVTMDAAHAVAVNSVGTGAAFEGNFATLLTSTSTAPGASPDLRQSSDFTVEGVFDLINPTELRQGYGIRLTDRVGNVLGNDTLDLMVRKAGNGVVAVQLRHLDQAGDSVTTVESIALTPKPQEDHILLRLSHVANSTAVSASFDLYAGNSYSRTVTFTGTDDIFHGETFTRAGFFADSPSPSISWLNGIYGALSIDSSGAWSYTLNNGSAAVQSLSEGETVHDVFTVDASDGHPGGTAQRTITIDVVGKNDAPTVTVLSAATTEDGAKQTFDLLSGAHDAELDPLTVRHFVPTAHDQNNVPVDLSGAFGAGAIVVGPHTVTIDPHYFDYLGAGQSVALVGDYDVFDGRADTHNTATLTISGVNDAPLLTNAALTITRGGTAVLGSSNIGISDPDSASFTFTVSNVTHGTFQTSVNGSWIDTTTFTTADLNAAHVRFVHDGSTTAPTFAVRADDGAATNNLSNVLAGSVSFTIVNQAPQLDLNGSAAGNSVTVQHIEGLSATSIIAPSATLSDADSANFNGGSLTVAFTANGTSNDQLLIANQGFGPGQIGIGGGSIFYGGAVIGAFSGGGNGTALVVSFTSDLATPAAVQALIRDIQFSNTSSDPQSAPRTLTFTVVDGDGKVNGGQDTASVSSTINVNVYPQFPLTTASDVFTGDTAHPHLVTATSSTLNSGDRLVGGGHDVLVLYNSGSFDIGSLAAFSGFASVDVENFTGSTASLNFGNRLISVDSAAPNGASIFNADPANWNGTASFHNVSISLGVGNGGNVGYELTGNTFSNVSLNVGSAPFSGQQQTAVTINVNSAALSGVTSLFGAPFGTTTYLSTSQATLDLTHTFVTNVSAVSTNAAGTTFIVDSGSEASLVAGGAGQDTLQASGFTFTAGQRDAIFATASVETIVDSTGTYTAPPPDPNKVRLTVGNDTIPATDGLSIIGTSSTLNSGDRLVGGGHDVLVLYNSGSFDIGSLAAFSGFASVDVENFTGSTASLNFGNRLISVDSAAPNGASIFNADPANWNGTASFHNVSISLGVGNGGNVGYELTGNTFSNVSLNVGSAPFSGQQQTAVTINVNSAALSGVTSLFGAPFGTTTYLSTSQATLDLTHTFVTNVSAVSTNAAGTTFIVDSGSEASLVAGGAGQDTLQASGFTFTAGQRDAIFATASIETIVDTSGTYHSANYIPPPDTLDVIVTGTEDISKPFSLASSGSAARGFVFDTVPIPAVGAIHYSDASNRTGTAVAGVEYAAGTSFTFVPATDWNGTAVVHYHAVATGGVADATPNDLTFQFAAVNDAPVAATAGNTASGNEDSTITGSVPAGSDVDDASGLTYALVSGPGAAQGALTFNNDGTFSFAPAVNFNGDVSFSYRVVDPHGAQSGPQNFVITVNPVNDAPVVEAILAKGDSAGTATPLHETNSGLAISGTLTVTDPDRTDPVTVSGWGVTHTGPAGGLTDGDLMGFFSVPVNPVLTASQTSAHFTWNFDSGNQAFNFLAAGETLSLHYTIQPSDGHSQTGTGNGTVTINIAGSNDAPVVTVTPAQPADVSEDGTLASAVSVSKGDPDASDVAHYDMTGWTPTALINDPAFAGHFYRYVPSAGTSWTDARAQASAMGGHLANITSQAENDFIQNTVKPHVAAWIGASDAAQEGTWTWADGPEAGQTFWLGDGNGTVVTYANWWGTEPNGGTSENYGFIDHNGVWTDVPVTNFAPQGFIVEFDDLASFTSYSLANAYGSAVFNTTTGELTFNLDNGSAAVQNLAAGDHRDVDVDIVVKDQSGAATIATATFGIDGVNDAPTIDAATLVAVDEDTVDPAGQTVGALFEGKFHDIDDGSSFRGVAIVGNNATIAEGSWQYKTPQSGIWENVGLVDAEHALIFSTATMLRFVPAPDFNGTPGGLEVLGVDDTYDEEFTVGAVQRYTEDTTDRGGSTPFSADTATLDTSVTPVNDAPVVTVETPVNHVLTSSNPDVSGRPAYQGVLAPGLNISSDSAVTAEFWLKDGPGDISMSFGFRQYDLLSESDASGNRYIGFNTGQGDLYYVQHNDLQGQWHHITAVFARDDVFQSKLYIDGVLQDLQPAGGADNAFATFSGDTAHIGGWGVTTQYTLDGAIDNVNIWHGERSAAEIAADMEGTITGPQPGLVASYTFEDVSDGAGGVIDSSGNGHHGTLSTLTTASVAVDSALVSEDRALVFSSANHNGISVSDIDSNNLSITLAVAHGMVTLHSLAGLSVTSGSDGSQSVTISGLVSALNLALEGLIYQPDPDYNGPDALVVTVSDGALSDTKTIDLAINPVNDAPVARSETLGAGANVLEDTVAIIQASSLLANDTDVDNDLLSLNSVTATASTHGTVQLVNGDVRFTPDANYNGQSSFSYTVKDSQGAISNAATVTFNVAAVNDAPVGVNESYSTNEDTPLTVAARGVLANDTDIDSDPATLTAMLVSGPAHGTLTLNSDGSFSYSPAANYNGPDSFTYRPRDATTTTGNLILNPGAELGSPIDDAGFGPVPAGWTNIIGNFTEVNYNASGGFLMENVGPAIGGGQAFFSGGPDNAVSQIMQTVDISSYAGDIDAGFETANLSGYFGGLVGQNDFTGLTARFRDSYSNDLGGISINSTGRPDVNTALIYQEGSSSVPVGARFIDVVLISTRVNGAYNDGYADNLSLTLTDSGPQGSVATVNLTVGAVNDAPVIAGPNPVTANVQEDTTTSASGQFTSSDADGDAPVWSVAGGTTPHPADYAFKALEFKLTGSGGTASFDDTFAVAPQNDALNYFIPVGSFATTSGGLLLDDEHAGNFTGDISGDNFVGQYATRTQNLNKADAFTLEGRFSLVIPADVRNGYGIVLTDSHGGGGNGNDALELMVQRGENGAVRVRLRDIDFSQNTDTTLDTSGLTGSYLADDQIALRAVHTAGSSALTFSYVLLHANGTQFGSGQLGSGTLFNGEDTTRAEIFGYALATAESYFTDPYGALSIDQAGAWTYSLRNGTSPVQSLAGGQQVPESFTVQVSDGHGGTDTRTVNVTVAGNNDAPVNTVPGAKSPNEDTTLAIPGVSVSDIDSTALTTTLHVLNGSLNVASGSGATVSGGNTATVTLSGTAAQINNALAGLSYKASANYSGPDTLSVQTSDGALSDTDNVTITVTAVNDAPAGTDATVTTAEDTSYTFTTSDFGLTDPNDSPANSLLAVKITTVPAAGALKDNGATVTAGQFVLLSDIVAGQLKFTPAANASGNGYTSFTFQVQDNGGTANGGINLDPTPNTITVNVTPVNDAPVLNFNPGYLKYHTGDTAVGPVSTWNIGAGSTDGVTLEGWVNWDGSTTGNQIPFYNGSGSTAGFGPIGEFLAPGLMEISILSGGVDVHRTNVSIAANQWHHIALTRLNGTISLYLDGALAATSNQGVNPITTADDANSNNVDSTYIGPSGSIAEVRVWNVARSGAEIAASMSSTLTGDETGLVGYWPLNDGSGTVALDRGHATDTHVVGTQQNLTVTGATWGVGGAGWPVTGVATNEDTMIALRGLSISDVDANGGTEQVTLAVGHGTLALGDATGVSVTQDGSLGTLRFTGSVAAINAALATGLNVTPTQNYGGGDTLSFTVDDQGNSGNGGAQSSTRQVAIAVAPTNDAPAGANATVTTAEDSIYTFTTADFGFSDPNDSPANSLLAVKITTVPAAGSLKDNNVTVNAGQFVSLSDITSGKLKFTPASDGNGANYASFTFQVQDNGGTANGGVDLDPTPNTITVNVTPVNDAPTLDVSFLTMTAFAEDTTPSQATVSQLFSSHFHDVDSGSHFAGLAVYLGAGPSNTLVGSWEYSVDTGATWHSIGPFGQTNTLLILDPNALLHFVPVADFNGTNIAGINTSVIDDSYAGAFTTNSTEVKVVQAVQGGTTPFGTFHGLNATVTSVNDAPRFSNLGPAAANTEQQFSLLDAGTDATVSDPELSNWVGTTLTLSRHGGANGQDSFNIDPTAGTNVTGFFTVNGNQLVSGGQNFATFNNANGVFTISFTAVPGVSTYNTVLAKVISHITYANLGDNPSPSVTIDYAFNDNNTGNAQGSGGPQTGTASVIVNITPVNDGPTAHDDTISSVPGGWVLDADNGHSYRLVEHVPNFVGATWAEANTQASADGAYLATITSAAEQAFVANLVGARLVWIGGSDDASQGASEGAWKWVAGPEAGTQFWTGGSNGSAVPGQFAAWESREPSSGAGENYLMFQGNRSGFWNDAGNGNQIAFVEEKGAPGAVFAGFAEDTSTTITATTLLANDSDADSLNLSITAVGTTSAHGGTVSLANNLISYTPAANFNGADSFSYTVSDGSLTSSATVSFNVAAGNDAPTTDINFFQMQAFDEDSTPSQATISQLFSAHFQDIDPGSHLAGLGILLSGGPSDAIVGSFQYSVDAGASWHSVGPFGQSNNYLVLDANTLLRFVPVADYNGGAAISVSVIDDSYAGGFTTNSGEVKVVPTSLGGTSSFSTLHGLGATVNAVDDAPRFSNLGPAAANTENLSSLLDGDLNASVYDPEIVNPSQGFENWAGTTLTLSRHGGANPDDSFGITGDVNGFFTVSGNQLISGGQTIGSFSNSGGILTVTFGPAGLNGLRVNKIVEQISYTNLGDNPASSVTIDYAFSDNNTANVQGSGGVQTGTGSVTVNITPVNDAPVATDNPAYLKFGAAASAAGSSPTNNVGNGAGDGVTIAGWFNWNGGDNAQHQQVLFYNGNTSNSGFGLNGNIAGGKLDLQYGAGGIGNTDTHVLLNANQWYHIAMTRVDGQFTLYVDGANVFSGGTSAHTFSGGDQLMVGGLPGGQQQFNGAIGDVSVWNSALTQAQIQGIEFTSLSGAETNLVGYYPLNDGSGTVAVDLVNSAGNLAISGSPVWAVNNADNWLANGVSTNEDTPLRLTALNISDVDAGADLVQVSLGVAHGVLALGSTAGLSASGLNSAAVTLTGTQSAINAALASGLTYTPAANYSGGDTLSITANDQGHNGSGGALSTMQSVALTVNQANNAPMLANPGTVVLGDEMLVSDSADVSYWPVYSADGSKLIYLAGPANNEGEQRIAVLDIATSTTTMIDAGDVLNFDGTNAPVVTYNGHFVAFRTDDPAVTGFSGQHASDYAIMIADTATGGRTLVSTNAAGQPLDDPFAPAFSPDGSHVAFWAGASTGSGYDIFVRSLTDANDVTEIPIHNAFRGEIGPLFSPDGSKLAFASKPNAFSDGSDVKLIDLHNIGAGPTPLLTDAAGGQAGAFTGLGAFSADGSKLAFWSNVDLLSAGTNGHFEIYIEDLATGNLTLASTNAAGAPSNGTVTDGAVFSPDGTRIAFYSDATNLLPGDTNGQADVFVKDLITGQITLVSGTADGQFTDSYNYDPFFSPDGSTIAFDKGDPSNSDNVFTKSFGTSTDIEIGQNAQPVLIAPYLSVSDTDGTSLVSAVIAITQDLHNDQDVLAVNETLAGAFGITVNFDASGGTLTLTGSGSLAHYQSLLRTVTYFNSSDTPSGDVRGISIEVNDGAAQNHQSNTATVLVDVNLTPTVDAHAPNNTPVYTFGDPSISIAPDLTLSDDDNSIVGATVSFAGFDQNDLLQFNQLNPYGITGAYNSATGILTLTGTATADAYQEVLRTTVFSHGPESVDTSRTISFRVEDDALNISDGSAATITLNHTPDAGSYGILSFTTDSIANDVVSIAVPANPASDADGDPLSVTLHDFLPDSFKLNGTAITEGQQISPAELGNLTFDPTWVQNHPNGFTQKSGVLQITVSDSYAASSTLLYIENVDTSVRSATSGFEGLAAGHFPTTGASPVEVPDGYGSSNTPGKFDGFDWSGANVINVVSTTAHNGTQVAYSTSNGMTITTQDHHDFVVDDLWVANLHASSVSDASVLTVTGYDHGVAVGLIAYSSTDGFGNDWLSTNSVGGKQLSSLGPIDSLTVASDHGFFKVDDFAFHTVPTHSAGPGNDVLVGNAADERFYGAGGSDTFVFNAFSNGAGHDTIGDFTPGQDRIQLDYSAFDPHDAADFHNWLTDHAAQQGNDVLIDLHVSGPDVDTILLKSVQLASLSMNDFLLHPGVVNAT
jgi:VCBS repeat-containing protein